MEATAQGSPSAGGDDGHPEIWLADFVRTKVVGPGGRRLGNVLDVEVRPLEGFRVAALVIGRFGFLGRFALVKGTTSELEAVAKPRIVDWSDVDRFDDRRVLLRGPSPARATSERIGAEPGDR